MCNYFQDNVFVSDVLSNFLGDLLAAVIAALFLLFIFRKPDFKLEVYSKVNHGMIGSIFFDLYNKKLFMSYDLEDIYYKIYLPTKFVKNDYTFEISTHNGWEKWDPLHNFKDKDKFLINNSEYILVNGVNKLNSFPQQKTTLFRINGIFTDKTGDYRIYYQFRTRYGLFPGIVRTGPLNLFIKTFKGNHVDVLNGKLPFSTLLIK